MGEGLYWAYETWVKSLESKCSSLLGANGSIFAMRKAAYYPINEKRGDDFELPVRAVLAGYAAILEPEAVSIEDVSTDTAAEFKRRVRIVSWNLASALILLKEAFRKRNWLLVYQLLSHKIMRWLVPFFMVAILLTSEKRPGESVAQTRQ